MSDASDFLEPQLYKRLNEFVHGIDRDWSDVPSLLAEIPWQDVLNETAEAVTIAFCAAVSSKDDPDREKLLKSLEMNDLNVVCLFLQVIGFVASPRPVEKRPTPAAELEGGAS